MSESKEPQEWLESLHKRKERAKADHLIEILEQFGAEDPISWVHSEMTEDMPQVATFLFLHEVRTKFVNATINRTLENEEPNLHPAKVEERGTAAFDRLIAAGANAEDLELFARGVASSTAENFILMLDGGEESVTDELEDAPHWILAEIDADDEDDLSGRVLDSLHENFGNLYLSDEAAQ